MRCRPVRKVEHHFVDVAPTTPFGRVIAFDDRMIGCAKMFCSVPIRRLIAATDMATRAADTQMQPGIAQFQAFLTPQRTRHNVPNSCDMLAKYCHGLPSRSI